MKRKSLSQTLVDASRELGLSKNTVDQLEELNVPRVKQLKPADIRRLREQMNASQGVFAKFLNVNVSTLQKWEQGVVKPRAASLKLLNAINDHGVDLLR